ncbi:MAG: 2-C-methyl-D-erythritol 2,4-cyclodiphosphate synthase [Spirochaetales bacterium]|nr:2-C-methyl-D-erythritol 2,4-cyclodiphosphate synthase [Spirochaetales bacterium]
MIKVGMGYDIHLLASGEKLLLGGVEISSAVGSVGHSDADALIHSIIDALFGAAGLGDIGEHFPPSDPAYRGISSRALLKKAAAEIGEQKFKVVNIDATVILEKPSLSSYKGQMRKNIAEDLHIDPHAVNIKAKTKEGVDATGEGRAVEAQAVVLLEGPSAPGRA